MAKKTAASSAPKKVPAPKPATTSAAPVKKTPSPATAQPTANRATAGVGPGSGPSVPSAAQIVGNVLRVTLDIPLPSLSISLTGIKEQVMEGLQEAGYVNPNPGEAPYAGETDEAAGGETYADPAAEGGELEGGETYEEPAAEGGEEVAEGGEVAEGEGAEEEWSAEAQEARLENMTDADLINLANENAYAPNNGNKQCPNRASAIRYLMQYDMTEILNSKGL